MSAGTIVGPLLRDVGDELRPEATKLFGSLESVAAKSDAGKALMGLWKNTYEPTLARTRQALIENATKNNTGETASQITSKAHNIARVQTFGPHDALIAHAVNWAAKTNGEEYAQTLADHVAMNLQDTIDKTSTLEAGSKKTRFGMLKNETRQVSSVKENILRNKDNTVPLNIDAVYQRRTKFEHLATNYMATMLAPFIAISHLSTPATNFLTIPLKDLTAGLGKLVSNYGGSKQLLLDTGIFNETLLNSYRDMKLYRSGLIAHATGSPTLGYILNKAIHAPFFNEVRDLTIAFAGTVGDLTVKDWAKGAAKGDYLASLQLKRLGLDPQKIAAQGGELTQDQWEQAIYRFVDDRVFLQSKTGRSFYAQKNQWTRMASMFHQYVSRQAKFMKDEAMTSWKAVGTNPLNFIKTFVALTVAFPAIGSVIEGLEDYGRGQNGLKETEQRYAKLFDTTHRLGEVEQYFDFLSHVAGVGILASYTRGLLRNDLANTLIGPIGNVAVRGLQDAASFAFNSTHNPKPLERDLVEDTLPDNLGKIIAHRYIPTKREEAERNPHKHIRFKGFKSKRFKNF